MLKAALFVGERFCESFGKVANLIDSKSYTNNFVGIRNDSSTAGFVLVIVVIKEPCWVDLRTNHALISAFYYDEAKLMMRLLLSMWIKISERFHVDSLLIKMNMANELA